MGHKKGVSHKSDRKILDVLFKAGGRLPRAELVRLSGLDERTITSRMKKLQLDGTVARLREPIHGNYVSYLIPWGKAERAYFYTYGMHSEAYSRLEEGYIRFLGKFGDVEQIRRPNGALKLTIHFSDRSIVNLSKIVDTFVAKYRWVNERPYTKVLSNGLLWLDGLLCEDCLSRRHNFPRAIRADPNSGQLTCPECGREYGLTPPTTSIWPSSRPTQA